MQEFLNENRGLFKLLVMSLVVLVLAFAVSAIVGVGNKVKEGKYIGEDVKSAHTINVSGEGEVYTKPDLAKVSFSVVNEANTVSAAMSQNTEKMNAVIKAVKEDGVKKKDLKTTRFNIHPRYEWRKPSEQLKLHPDNGKRILAGYEVTQSLQVKIRDLESVGSVISAATGAGANKVGNINFSVEDEEAVKKQARKKAIKAAKEKAKNLASQLGVKLGEIVDFNEGYSAPRYYKAKMEAAPAGRGSASGAPNVQGGENKIQVNVDITYRID